MTRSWVYLSVGYLAVLLANVPVAVAKDAAAWLQAVGMKTRLRASAWKSDSPGWALMVLAPLLIETL